MTTNMLIAPFKTGLQTDLEPWIAPPDSFEILDNAHLKHGFIQKRSGYQLFANLKPMGATVGGGINDITQTDPAIVTTVGAHGLTTGDLVYIAAVGGMTELNNKIFEVTYVSADKFSININATVLTAYTVGGTVTPIDSSTDRVMGITQYIDASNTYTSLAFNARRAYSYDFPTNLYVQLDTADIFTGMDETDFIWSTNWQNSSGSNKLYFTNGLKRDPIDPTVNPSKNGIRTYDSTVSTTATADFTSSLGGTRTIIGGKLIFTLGQRLIVLNVFEYDSATVLSYNYPQRARWCAKQVPTNWNDTVAGGGGYADAATGDHIISARALQNQIIVFFTNSIWSLVATSDPNRPFRWQKINSFRACGGKMASVGYDRYVVALGNRGITATDGVETRRVDDQISDFVDDAINQTQFKKVFCERSYKNKRWWTLYNDTDYTDDENNSALIYDDDSAGYSTYTINMNCLGYGSKTQDNTLDDFTIANGFFTKDDAGNILEKELKDYGENDLLSYWQQNEQRFLGGDINGSVFTLEDSSSDDGNEITTTLFTAGWNPFKEEKSKCVMPYIDILIDTDIYTTAVVEFYVDNEPTAYAYQNIDFLPDLKFIARISSITKANPANVEAFNHGLSTGDVVYIYGVNGMNQINSGSTGTSYTITVVDGDNFTLDGINSSAFSAYTDSGSIYFYPFYKTKTWKRIFAGGTGYQHRLKFIATGNQDPFKIHAFQPTFKRRGNREI